MSQKRLSEVRTSRQESGEGQRLFSFKATQFIWLGLALLEALILMRIGLKIIGANPENVFAGFIYGFSHLFLFPFDGLINTPAAGQSVLELSSLIAMLVYALLAWAIERTVWLIFYRPRESGVGVTQTRTIEQPDHATPQTTTSEPVAVGQTSPREAYLEDTSEK